MTVYNVLFPIGFEPRTAGEKPPTSAMSNPAMDHGISKECASS